MDGMDNFLHANNMLLHGHHQRPCSHDKHPVYRTYYVIPLSGQRQALGAILKVVLCLMGICDSEVTPWHFCVDERKTGVVKGSQWDGQREEDIERTL